MTAARQRLGAIGERRAAAWYEERGYTVLARNWRGGRGELDLLCTRDGILVVCEVKTRSSLAYGHPAEAVDAAKQRQVRALAGRWLQEQEQVQDHGPRYREIRFDVAAVLPGSVEVVEAAF